MEQDMQPNQQLPVSQSSVSEEPQRKPSDRYKNLFYQVMIGCLVSGALIAVFSVLAGGFNDVLERALLTILAVAVHAIISFSYVTQTEATTTQGANATPQIFGNVVFGLIVSSFVTSLFALWELLGGEIAGRLFAIYGVLLFATIHAQVLHKIRGYEEKIDATIYTNYLFMGVVVALLSILILSPDPDVLGDYYPRVLAAFAIIDATLTILIGIMYKMYLQRNPAVAATLSTGTDGRKRNPLVTLAILYLGLQIGAPLLIYLFIGILALISG